MNLEDKAVDFSWMSKSGASIQELVDEAVEQLRIGSYDPVADTHDQQNLDDRRSSVSLIRQLAYKTISQGVTTEEVEATLQAQSKNLSSPDMARALIDARPLLRAVVVRASLGSTYTLQDFDWSVKLRVSSSRSASLLQPVLSLTLQIACPVVTDDKSTRTGPDKIYIELTTVQVEQLINQLTEALNKMNQISN